MEIAENNNGYQGASLQGDVDLDLFYEQCNRRLLLEEAKRTLSGSVSILTILGEHGSGKTMLCRMLERELSSSHLVVFFLEAVESFEDVLKPVALKVGIHIDGEIRREDVNELISEIISQLQEDDKKLLVIFDEAEKIFLATLERIRKMLDLLNADNFKLQILFSGESSLQTNLEQLALCNFQAVTEHTLPVQPLSEEETFGYLNFLLHSFGETEKIITMEQAQRVYSRAEGNFAATNDEARALVEGSASISVLSPTSGDSPVKRRKKRTGRKQSTVSYPSWLKDSYFLSGTSVLVAVVLLVVFLLKNGKNSGSVNEDEKGENTVIQQITVGSQEEQEKKLVEAKQREDLEANKKAETKKQTVARKKTVEKKTETKSTAIPERNVAAKEKKRKSQKQRSEKINTESGTEIEAQPFIVISSESSRYVSGKSSLHPRSIEKRKRESIDQLFNKRVVEATKWSMSPDEKLYTIQLMVLTAEHAEENVKKILEEQEYRDISDKLYIMKSLMPTPSVYIYYGEFPSKVSALTARNTLPMFLRKHNPYVTSVKNAIEKAGVEKDM